MSSFLLHDLATIALCWRLERRDGVTLGFTSHDRDLTVDGLIYRAAPGMLPSSISVSDGFDADSVDVKGALTSSAIRAQDMRAGRWDGASLAIFMTDWESPGAEALILARGELGEVSISGEAFEAELKGPTSALERPVVEQMSPECRATLGDRRCRVDMAGRVRLARVVTSDGAVVTLDALEPSANAYGYGRLRWIGGPNSGLASLVRSSAGDQVTLREAPAFVPVEGDLLELSEGCDRSLATCSARFGNVVNFRGEPHLPGMDLLTRYPGA
ncbi:DUF2163 domain-containing protein [Sphingosinicella sp. YJ22]|uniref:DUF2163 domain-containing protein n=1 Tax=Sphingosinicella sp. YJ22 TaxID=1104780 RepID=UPI00140AB551|nr:DUF2163 domain-containing protein [Sphingosinicella sp. YJ22]